MANWQRLPVDAGLLLGYMALIFVLSNRPLLPTPLLFPHQDKLIHLAEYALLTLLCWRAFMNARIAPGQIAFASALFASLYGLSDEYHQSFTPGRNADALDWAADSLSAVLTAWLLHRRKHGSDRRESTGG